MEALIIRYDKRMRCETKACAISRLVKAADLTVTEEDVEL